MKRSLFLFLPFSLLILLMAACDGDDYVYPSVKLEFLTAATDSRGSLQTVTTDEGLVYEVLTDGSGLSITADSTARIVAYYEELTDDDGSLEGVKLYSATRAVAPNPKTADEYEDGVVTKPAAVRSIWLGYNYLNIVLTAKQQGTHTIGFVERSVEDEDGERSIDILLYHDTDSDVEDYTKTAYLSIPLLSYLTSDVDVLYIDFSLYTDEDELRTYSFSYSAR